MAAVETGSPDVRADLADGVLVVTLDRPEARNALSAGLLDGLAAAITVAENDAGVRVLLLTGAGGAFSAGGDVDLMARGLSIFGDHDDPAGRTAAQTEAQRRTIVRLHELATPTIAALPGPTVGAGLSLALACDLRYAATSASLMTGFSRVGLAGDFGCSWLLHHLVGPATAKELLYRSAPVPAEEAARKGLVNDVYADAELAAQVLRIARSVARVSAPAMAEIVATARAVTTLGFAEACDRDADTHVRLTLTPEHRSAVQALVTAMKGT